MKAALVASRNRRRHCSVQAAETSTPMYLLARCSKSTVHRPAPGPISRMHESAGIRASSTQRLRDAIQSLEPLHSSPPASQFHPSQISRFKRWAVEPGNAPPLAPDGHPAKGRVGNRTCNVIGCQQRAPDWPILPSAITARRSFRPSFTRLRLSTLSFIAFRLRLRDQEPVVWMVPGPRREGLQGLSLTLPRRLIADPCRDASM